MILDRLINQIKGDPLSFIVAGIIGLCIVALFTAILINFIEAKGGNSVKKEKKSVVATGTMTLFFIVYYLIIKYQIGSIRINSFAVNILLVIIGLGVIIFGCVFNIMGRLKLGQNWGNQIRIYDDHYLVQTGTYKIVRHPLYASIIWMFYGASLVYTNWAAFLANTLIFVPFMYYRAQQEEKLLTERFLEYNDYKTKTGMFFPKIKL